MKPRTPIYGIIADAALIACCALAAVCVLPTAFEEAFNSAQLAIAEGFIAIILSYSLHKVKKYRFLPCFFFSLAAVLFFIIDKESVVNGAKLLWYSAAKLLSLDFAFLQVPSIPENVLFPAQCVTEFLILEAAVISLLAAILLIKCRVVIPLLILPIPFMVLGFIYTDCPPAFYTVMLLLIYWGGILFGRETLKTDPYNAGLGRALFIVLLTALVLVIPLLSPMEKYDPIPFSSRRGFLDSFGLLRDRLRSGFDGIPKEYELSSEGEREFDESIAFSVNCSAAGTFYLRTHSYGRYGYNTWRAADGYKGGWTSLLALGNTQYGVPAYLRIRGANMTERPTPYAFRDNGNLIIEESFIRAGGRSAYVWVFLPYYSASPGNTPIDEDDYYKFALQQYTLADGEVKTELLDLLSKMISLEALEKVRNIDEYTAAAIIADLVSESCTYSLKPGSVPERREFVEYFLTENRKGYCVHFATATTALLQAAGIPARYVIGYRVEVDTPETWIDVRRLSSHAWTEVYIKNVGWLPLESTAGFNDHTHGGWSHGAVLPTQTPNVPYISPVPETEAPIETPRPTRVPAAQGSAKPTEAAAPGGEENTGTKIKFDPWLLSIIPAAIVIWEVIGVFIRKRRKKSFEQSNSKAAVLAMLEYLKKIRRYGAALYPDAERIANEAAFSNHPMCEEQKKLIKFVENNQYSVCRHAPLLRFALRWITFKI